MKKKFKNVDFVICPNCKYHNLKHNSDFFGTCRRCGEVIDEKAKFKYEMNKKLRLWRGTFK